MAHQKGANVELLLGYEDVAFKTAATAGFNVPVNSFSVIGNQALNGVATLTGSRNPAAPYVGNKTVTGTIAVPADSIAMWYWFKAMFDDPVTTGIDPYVHEYKIPSAMPSMTLETAFTDLATDKFQRFVGCKVSGWSITAGGDAELVSTIDIVGALDSLETSAFDAAPTAVTIGRVNNFSAALTEGGGALSNATELSLKVDFGIDSDQYVIGSSGVIGSLPEGICAVSGNIKTLFEDDSLLTKAMNDTETSLKLTITESASSIFEIELQELLYERNSIDIPGPAGLLVDLNFQGFYTNGSEESAIVARLTNSEAHA